MKNAERIVISLIVIVLLGGAAWGYYAVSDKRSDYRERIAAGEFEIRQEEPTGGQVSTSSAQSDWRSIYPNTVSILLADVPVQASVADTLSARIKGLSGTPYLPDNVVKLFAFGVAGSHSIWMKDMNYPIDIIWADEAGVIVHFEKNVAPETYPASFASPTPAWFVIETVAGFVDTHSVEIGDTIILPVS